MSVGEFETIERYFHRSLPARDDVLTGIGDDGALLRIAGGHTLVTAVATLSTAAWDEYRGDASRLGRRVMAVAMNRLAAAGAQPAWATLALTLPETRERWLEAFSEALFAVATPLSVVLIGGDTTRGPFTVTVVGHGLLERGVAQTVARTRVGDAICVSGSLGDGSLDNATATGDIRVALGRWIRRHAGVAEDTSEGLGPALLALLGRHHLGARIDLPRLPLAMPLSPGRDDDNAWLERLTRSGGAELCFTLALGAVAGVEARRADDPGSWTRIGSVNDSGRLECVTSGGRILELPAGDAQGRAR